MGKRGPPYVFKNSTHIYLTRRIMNKRGKGIFNMHICRGAGGKEINNFSIYKYFLI